VNYHNDNRAPLLFISGTQDHLMPPSIQRSNAKHYKSNTITEIKEFDGPHLLPAQDGWEDDSRHHAHRRADRADRGRRVAAAHRPDLRLPRPQVHLRVGVGVPETARAGNPARRHRADRRGAAQP